MAPLQPSSLSALKWQSRLKAFNGFYTSYEHLACAPCMERDLEFIVNDCIYISPGPTLKGLATRPSRRHTTLAYIKRPS